MYLMCGCTTQLFGDKNNFAEVSFNLSVNSEFLRFTVVMFMHFRFFVRMFVVLDVCVFVGSIRECLLVRDTSWCMSTSWCIYRSVCVL